jgi:hypothetical protein
MTIPNFVKTILKLIADRTRNFLTGNKNQEISYFKYIVVTLIISFGILPLIILFYKVNEKKQTAFIPNPQYLVDLQAVKSSDFKYYSAYGGYGSAGGHTDPADIWVNGHNQKTYIENSEIIILGNSRSQLGLSAEIFDLNYKIYNLSFGCRESIKFPLQYLEKNPPKNLKLILINADTQFMDEPSRCVKNLLHEDIEAIASKYQKEFGLNDASIDFFSGYITGLNYFIKGAFYQPNKIFDILSDIIINHQQPQKIWSIIEYRSAVNGRWYGMFEISIPVNHKNQIIRISTNSCPLSERRIKKIQEIKLQIKKLFPFTKIVTFLVPNPEYCLTWLSEVNKYINPDFTINNDGFDLTKLYTFDNSHLAQVSAKEYTKFFLGQLLPYLSSLDSLAEEYYLP